MNGLRRGPREAVHAWTGIVAVCLLALAAVAPHAAAKKPAPAPLPGPAPAPSPAPATPPAEGYTPVPITGTTYYVSPSGSDANAGTSTRKPWQTVKRVNRAKLAPGDGVLFLGGATFADDALMPGTSGAPGAPVVFGAYGSAPANLSRGVWFGDRSHLAFRALVLDGPGGVFQGKGNGITVQGLTIARSPIGVYAEGADWVIEATRVESIGDSGMIVLGERPTIRGCTIVDTGRDETISYGRHGIYLKASGASVRDNTIRNFADNGVSVRDRDSVVERNAISGGPIGIAWFQEDPLAGSSRWSENDVSQTTAAGIYVSREDSAGRTRESFAIVGNQVKPDAGRHLDLHPTTGTYRVEGNDLR